MSRANPRKEARRWQKLFQDASRLEARQGKSPCSSCAMADAYAWIADPGMAHKLIQCLAEPSAHQFFCHEGLPVGGATGTSYQPPRTPEGQIDTTQLTPCGGFLRWAVPYRCASLVAQTRAVLTLQLRMVTRFLKSDHPEAMQFRKYPPLLLQEALNEQSLGIAFEEAPHA